MRRITGTALALLVIGGCGGGGNEPNEINVQGLWVVTFTSNVGSACSVSSISLTLLADGSSPFEGSFGSSAVTCTGQASFGESAGNIAAYQVSGKNVSVQFTNNPNRSLFGSLNGSTITGTFSWNSTTPGKSYSITGTFTAAKQ